MHSVTRFVASLAAVAMIASVQAKPSDTLNQSLLVADAREPASPHDKLMRFLLQPVGDTNQLRGRRVAILAADGVDGFELDVPRTFLTERGATVHVVVPRSSWVLQATGSGAVVKAKTEISVQEPSGESDSASFDRYVDQVNALDYDAIYVPGHPGATAGISDDGSVAFLRGAARAGKTIFAAGNAPDVLLRAGLLESEYGSRQRGAVARLNAAEDRQDAARTSVYATRDPFDIPDLMAALVATLLANPAAETR